ncbi:hypothetical protein E7W33_09840 [Cronobacter sakazakii]|nr:hypothetical protein [Cronobacter sakazakii]
MTPDRSSAHRGANSGTFLIKGVDLYTRLLYNLATPRYNKVFFPKLLCAENISEGVGLRTLSCEPQLNLSVWVFANV